MVIHPEASMRNLPYKEVRRLFTVPALSKPFPWRVSVKKKSKKFPTIRESRVGFEDLRGIPSASAIWSSSSRCGCFCQGFFFCKLQVGMGLWWTMLLESKIIILYCCSPRMSGNSFYMRRRMRLHQQRSRKLVCYNNGTINNELLKTLEFQKDWYNT